MRGATVLISPLVGALVLAGALTGCGGSDSPSESDTGVASTVAMVATTTDAPIITVAPPSSAPSTVSTTTTIVAAPATTAPQPGMTAAELTSLESELDRIDAILGDLDKNFAAD